MKEPAADFVVVGAGVAGLRAAIELAEAGGKVLVLAKDGLDDSSTRWAQGGIAAVFSPDDAVEDHVADTLAAGVMLCEESAVRILVEEGPARVRELMDWGARFDHRQSGGLALTREGAHSRRRVLHAHGDATGREIARALVERARGTRGLALRPGAFAAGLLVDEGRCRGVRVLDDDGLRPLAARAVLLATGGVGRLYAETTNPPQITGEGLALAWDAGAELMDVEFVQFHPTVLDLPGAPRFLLSEALRGEGAVLRNGAGQRFMVGRHPMEELAPRDVVTREIFRELTAGRGPVALDLTHLDPEFVRPRFPTIYATCGEHGLDITADTLPVRPAAHYAMGGVRTDLEGRSSVPGLYAAGEAACAGIHGANRLASNSLLDGLVFGARAGAAMAAEGAREAAPTRTMPEGELPAEVGGETATLVRRLAWSALGAVRDGVSLQSALAELGRLPAASSTPEASRPAVEEAGALRLVRVMLEAALRREESRGAHWREDYPDPAAVAVHSVVDRKDGHRAVPVGRGALTRSD